MSWLSLPLFKSEQSDPPQTDDQEENDDDDGQEDHGGSVKEDLSELGKTISRQLWGVASFLAPPPSPSATATITTSDSSSHTLLGIRNDFAEISGSFKSGLSRISTAKAVNEISKLASNLLQFQDQDDDKGEEEEEEEGEEDDQEDESTGGGGVGITEEVLEFVREMSMRPQCWTDFPLPLDDHDFDMSTAQREHVAMVESLVPSLEALRIKLCPSQMNEEHFWMIYFILLHPRLDNHDSEILSIAKIVEARDLLLHKLGRGLNTESQTSKSDDSSVEVTSMGINVEDNNRIGQEKEVLAETVSVTHQEAVDDDQWLEEDVETGTSADGRNQLGNEQDVSFSDLEDDDNDTSSRQGGSSPIQNVQVSSPNGSSGWVQLNENSEAGGSRQKTALPSSREKDSEGEESNEWLKVDDFD